jgi:hypothetical protein
MLPPSSTASVFTAAHVRFCGLIQLHRSRCAVDQVREARASGAEHRADRIQAYRMTRCLPKRQVANQADDTSKDAAPQNLSVNCSDGDRRSARQRPARQRNEACWGTGYLAPRATAPYSVEYIYIGADLVRNWLAHHILRSLYVGVVVGRLQLRTASILPCLRRGCATRVFDVG